MALGFKIDANLAWSDGGTTPSAPNQYIATPDKAIKNEIKPSVLKISFGDGYEQRIKNGINNIKETYAVTFNTRPKEEIDAIISTLKAKDGVDKFDFTVPDENSSGDEKTIKVVCETFSQSYDYTNYYSATATFRRVYEA